MNIKEEERKLDKKSELLIKRLQERPDDQKKKLIECLFDVAIAFHDVYMYRIIMIRFDRGKMYFIRHGKIYEEILFTSFADH